MINSDNKSDGINVQSPRTESTPRRLTLDLCYIYLLKGSDVLFKCFTCFKCTEPIWRRIEDLFITKSHLGHATRPSGSGYSISLKISDTIRANSLIGDFWLFFGNFWLLFFALYLSGIIASNKSSSSDEKTVTSSTLEWLKTEKRSLLVDKKARL